MERHGCIGLNARHSHRFQRSWEKSVLEFGGSISRLRRKGMPAVTGENDGNASISKRRIDKLAVGRVVTWLKLATGETD